MTNKLELKERRESLERKVLAVFHAAHDMPETYGSSIGKYDIKRTLEFSDKTLRVSINTVKRIVDKMLDDGVIECVNPKNTCGLRFRLMEDKDSKHSSTRDARALYGEDWFDDSVKDD